MWLCDCDFVTISTFNIFRRGVVWMVIIIYNIYINIYIIYYNKILLLTIYNYFLSQLAVNVWKLLIVTVTKSQSHKIWRHGFFAPTLANRQCGMSRNGSCHRRPTTRVAWLTRRTEILWLEARILPRWQKMLLRLLKNAQNWLKCFHVSRFFRIFAP